MIIKKPIPILEALKKLKPADFIYPGIFVFFLCIVLVVFFTTMQFISKNINSALAPEESGASQALDIEKYRLVAKRLNIEATPASIVVAQAEIPTAQAIATNTNAVALDKKSLSIVVKNSTSKSGVATVLAKSLEDNGFTKPQTGNEPKQYATTTILLKESKGAYGAVILEVVHKIYPAAIVATTTEPASADATIVIGVR